MRRSFALLIAIAVSGPITVAGEINPAIDMVGHLRSAREAAADRDGRRVSEQEFIRMSGEPNTIILDARGREKYEELHLAGALNLSFTDFTAEALRQVIPNENTRILIYCNNNFEGAEGPFPRKAAAVALNLSTWVALNAYGYRNVYELAPLVDVDRTMLRFEGRLAAKNRAQRGRIAAESRHRSGRSQARQQR